MHQILVTYCLHTVFLAPFWRPLRRRIASYLDSDLGVSKTVLHDASGNVTDNGKVTLVYDATEQPVSMGGAAAGTFLYDGHYRRAKQVIDGETVYSFYDLSGAMLFRDNVTTGVNTEYVRLAGETIARLTNQPGSNYSYLHPDHLGSAVAATDPNGALLWREHYTAYGEKMLNPAANDNHDGFTGHVSDEASGLTYMQARYYDPVIARFLSADPVGFVESGFNPQYFNRYSYALNDPVNNIDPDGRACVPCITGAIGGAIGGGVEIYKIKSGGGKILSRNGLSQIGKGIGIGAVAGATGGVASTAAATAGKAAVAQAGARTALRSAAPKAVQGAANGAVGGGVASGTQDALTQAVETGSIEGGQVAEASVRGAVAGAIGGGIGGQVEAQSAKAIFGDPRANAIFGQTPGAISGTATGETAGAVTGIAIEQTTQNIETKFSTCSASRIDGGC